MNASELYRSGKLDEALQAQLQEVKAHPADTGKRLFLFELAAFAGDLDRARRQIEAVSYDDPQMVTSVLQYRVMLDSEEARRKLFTEALAPRFFGDQPEHVHLRLQAALLMGEERHADAAEVLRQAEESTPVTSGTLNGRKFDVLRDADDLFGGVLEVFAQGGYFWVPFEQIESVTAAEPRFPRDLLWPAARLEMRDGSGGNVFLPALYPGSYTHTDPLVRLGRHTEWVSAENGPVRGYGGHTYLVGEDAVALLEWRELILDQG